MAVSGIAVAYCCAGGLVLYSGIKGATISSTVKAALGGSLSVSNTEPVTFGSSGTGSGTGSSGQTVTGGKASQSAAANQALAKQIATQLGHADWTTGQNWSDWVSLWNQESGWSATADNPASGAYGIPQALPATKMPKAAQPPPAGTSDPGAQISWGIEYIAGRYGSPVMAWAHEQANNWY
jgi:hypothetical protein